MAASLITVGIPRKGGNTPRRRFALRSPAFGWHIVLMGIHSAINIQITSHLSYCCEVHSQLRYESEAHSHLSGDLHFHLATTVYLIYIFFTLQLVHGDLHLATTVYLIYIFFTPQLVHGGLPKTYHKFTTFITYDSVVKVHGMVLTSSPGHIPSPTCWLRNEANMI